MIIIYKTFITDINGSGFYFFKKGTKQNPKLLFTFQTKTLAKT